MTDTRIVYGTRCTWWDSIKNVGSFKTDSGHNLPVCPHCGSPLFEVDSEEKWFAGVDKHEAVGNIGYRDLVEYGRGKCFRNYDELKKAYNARLP